MRPLDSAQLTLQVEVEKWPLRVPFRISGSTVLNLDVVVVTLAQLRRHGGKHDRNVARDGACISGRSAMRRSRSGRTGSAAH